MERCPKTSKAVLGFNATKSILKKTLRHKPDREKDDFTMYHCPICHGWHVGHDDGRKTKRYEYDLKRKKEEIRHADLWREAYEGE